MRKKANLKSGLLVSVVLLSVLSGSVWAYSGGDGSEGNPYQIGDANDMQEIGAEPNDWDKHFLLIADVNLAQFTGTQFNIIGNDVNDFTGVFDGNDHTISSFTYTSTGTDYIALFGYVGSGGQIKNLGLVDPNVAAGTGDFVGGLVGQNSYGTISNCYATGSVSGDGLVGGLAGYIYPDGMVSNCYATGSVTGTGWVGGLVGINYGTVSNCYATGGVDGNNFVGGLVGLNQDGTVSNCYAAGAVSGNTNVGGLVGWDDGVSYTSCFWDSTVNNTLAGVGNIADPCGVMGRTTAQMQTQSTFTDYGWDFVGETANGTDDIWIMWQNYTDYPRLTWAEGLIEPSYPGSGTAGNPYRISTAEEMNEIGRWPYHWGANFVLVNDISLAGFTGTQFNIIGTSDILPFTGVFDGNDHTINNFTYTTTATNYIGLFGYVGSGGEIRDLGMVNVDIDAGRGDFVGGLVGRNYGTFSNCYASGSVTGGYYVGGLVGHTHGMVSNSYSTGSVSGNSNVGGLVGRNYGTVSNCYASGSVTGGYNLGGLVGYNYGPISDSYATGNVSGIHEVGGLVGVNWGTISNCYAAGSVSGAHNVGGLVGRNYDIISNCYATGTVTGGWWVGGLVGRNYYWTVSNCYATGSVSGYWCVGGLVGYIYYYCTFSNCYATGTVTGVEDVGGLVGKNSHGTISNCYATGSVSGTTEVGGLVGQDYRGSYTSCFWNSDIGPAQGIGNTTDPDVMGRTTAQMQTQSTFTDYGWDFVGETVNGSEDIWTIKEGVKYPEHVWPLVNFIGWYEVDLLDYAFFAGRWGDENCGTSNDCDGADLDFSGAVDGKDLKIFCQHWLAGVE